MHFYYSFTFTLEAPFLLILHSLGFIPSGPRFWRESYKSSCHYYSSRVSNFYSFSVLCDFFLSHSSPVRLFQIFVTFPQFSTGPFTELEHNSNISHNIEFTNFKYPYVPFPSPPTPTKCISEILTTLLSS